MHSLSVIHVDGIDFQLCGVSKLQISILQRTGGHLIGKGLQLTAEESLTFCVR